MNRADALNIALQEFIHVGGALVVIIAVVSVFTGLLREYIPQEKLQKTVGGNKRFGSLIGAAFGILTPFCSASVVPVSMGMAESGVALGTIFSFLISAPLCNFVVIGMILAMFGMKVTLAYFVLTFGSAVLCGIAISRSPWRNEVKRGVELKQSKRSAPTCGEANACDDPPAGGKPSACGASAPVAVSACASLAVAECACGSAVAVAPVSECCGASPVSVSAAAVPCDRSSSTFLPARHQEKVQHALRFAWALFKRIIPYVLVGAAISGLSAAFLPGEMVEKYIGGSSWYAIPVAAGIGVPLYLRIEMAIPLLKVLIAKGMGMGAAMALLIGGTGASLPEIALISAVLKPKAVVAFVGAVFSTAVIAGVVYQYVL